MNLDDKTPKENHYGENMGYLQGYNITLNDDGTVVNESTPGADGKSIKKRISTNKQKVPLASYSTERRQSMPTIDEDSFKYGLGFDNDFEYEDPTFLGFEIKLNIDTSPLFNYGQIDTKAMKNSALNFIESYSNIPEIERRKDIYFEFRNQLFKIFDAEFKTAGTPGFTKTKNQTYYIEDIIGLDKLMNKMVNTKEDKITITLTEDVSMRAMYLSELYNNLCYSYKFKHTVVPINCLRFDMMIKVSDIRNFKLSNGEMNTNPPCIIYSLYDCNFDFQKSQNTEANLSVGGFGALNTDARKISFDITYKSINREFSSSLIKNSINISGSKTNIVNDPILKSEDNFTNDKKSNIRLEEEKNKLVGGRDKLNDIGNIGGRIAQTASKDKMNVIEDYLTNIVDVKKQAIMDIYDSNLSKLKKSVGLDSNQYLPQKAKSFIDDVVGDVEFNVETYYLKVQNLVERIKGGLIKNVVYELRTNLNVPVIYPENVYDENFYDLSAENFVGGLISDLSNTGEDALNNLIPVILP